MRLPSYLSGMIAAAGLFAPVAAEPREEPLETDRPDITETSTVVGAGRLQIETSIQVERRRGGDDERLLLTPTLFRWGFHRRWEARLETDGSSRSRLSAGPAVLRTAGYAPLSIGAKHHFQDPREGSGRPSVGAILHIGLPSGSGAFRTRKLTGELKAALDWELSPRWSLGVNAGPLVDEDEAGNTFLCGLVTASLARSLTSRLRTYAELALQAPEARRGGRALILDGGFAYLLDRNTQIDAAVGTGLAGRTPPDLYWTVGFSHRF